MVLNKVLFLAIHFFLIRLNENKNKVRKLNGNHSHKKRRDYVVMFHPKVFADESFDKKGKVWRHNNIKNLKYNIISPFYFYLFYLFFL